MRLPSQAQRHPAHCLVGLPALPLGRGWPGIPGALAASAPSGCPRLPAGCPETRSDPRRLGPRRGRCRWDWAPQKNWLARVPAHCGWRKDGTSRRNPAEAMPQVQRAANRIPLNLDPEMIHRRHPGRNEHPATRLLLARRNPARRGRVACPRRVRQGHLRAWMPLVECPRWEHDCRCRLVVRMNWE